MGVPTPVLAEEFCSCCAQEQTSTLMRYTSNRSRCRCTRVAEMGSKGCQEPDDTLRAVWQALTKIMLHSTLGCWTAQRTFE